MYIKNYLNSIKLFATYFIRYIYKKFPNKDHYYFTDTLGEISFTFCTSSTP